MISKRQKKYAVKIKKPKSVYRIDHVLNFKMKISANQSASCEFKLAIDWPNQVMKVVNIFLLLGTQYVYENDLSELPL